MTKTMKRLLTCAVFFLALPLLAAPEPSEILRSSVKSIAAAKNIRLRARIMNDEVTAGGQKLQRSYDAVLKIRRPDAFRVDNVADRYRRILRYDGKMIYLFDPDKMFYAKFPAPPTIDATMASMKEKLGLDLPLSNLFAADAAEVLGSKKQTEAYVGLHRVEGVPCHHLAFTQENVDWQIWIEAEGSKLPRKVVIDFKNRPGRPQYIAILSDWSLNAMFPAGEFDFTAPPNAQEIEFAITEGPLQ